MVKCAIHDNNPATVNIIYGLYDEYKKGRPHYNINLCDICANELWDKSKSAIQVQLMHWVNKSI